MRILYLCHSFPFPPTKGEKIRAFEQLQFLGRRHHVHVLALGSRQEIQEHRSALSAHCAVVEGFPLSRSMGAVRSAVGALGARPLTLSFFRSPALRKRVRELGALENFDLVYASGSAMAPYAELVEATPRVLDMVDVDSAKWDQYSRFTRFPRRLVYQTEFRRLRAYEASLGQCFDQVVLTTRRETELLRSFAPDIESETIRVGLDPDQWRPLNLPKAEAPTLVFTGQMDYFPNADAVSHFARDLLPELRRRIPNLRFLIVGRSPTPSVLALERIPGVVVTGAVPEIRPFLATSTIFVAPLRIAQGVQLKVLEAMASGLPVVGTPCVMEGIEDSGFRDRKHLLIAPDDRAFAELVIELAGDRDLCRRIGSAARRQLFLEHSTRKSMSKLEQLLLRTVARGSSSKLPADRLQEQAPFKEARLA